MLNINRTETQFSSFPSIVQKTSKTTTFKGRYDPDGAQTWLKEIERVFRVMECTEVQKVCFGTHMLVEEADDWLAFFLMKFC